MKRPWDQLKYSTPMKIVHKMQQRNNTWAIVVPGQASETEKETLALMLPSIVSLLRLMSTFYWRQIFQLIALSLCA